jgi:hypothetical protein
MMFASSSDAMRWVEALRCARYEIDSATSQSGYRVRKANCTATVSCELLPNVIAEPRCVATVFAKQPLLASPVRSFASHIARTMLANGFQTLETNSCDGLWVWDGLKDELCARLKSTFGRFHEEDLDWNERANGSIQRREIQLRCTFQSNRFLGYIGFAWNAPKDIARLFLSMSLMRTRLFRSSRAREIVNQAVGTIMDNRLRPIPYLLERDFDWRSRLAQEPLSSAASNFKSS